MKKFRLLTFLLMVIISCNRNNNQSNINKLSTNLQEKSSNICLDTMSRMDIKLFLNYYFGMKNSSVDSLTNYYKKEKIIKNEVRRIPLYKNMTVNTEEIFVNESLMEIRFDYLQLNNCFYLTDVFLSSIYSEWGGKEFCSLINNLNDKYKQIYKSKVCIIYKGEKKIIKLIRSSSRFTINLNSRESISNYEIHFTSVEEHNRRVIDKKNKIKKLDEEKKKRNKFIKDNL